MHRSFTYNASFISQQMTQQQKPASAGPADGLGSLPEAPSREPSVGYPELGSIATRQADKDRRSASPEAEAQEARSELREVEHKATRESCSLGAPVRQTVAVRFMQGRRGVQEDRHIVVNDIKTLVEPGAKLEVDSWGVSPASLVALFDGHRGVVCSDFCASNFASKLADLLTRKLPEQVAAKQLKGSQTPATSPSSGGSQNSGGGPEKAETIIPLSASSFTGPAPHGPVIDSCCCRPLRGLLPSLPDGLQRLMPSLYHRLFSAFKQTDKEFIDKFKVKANAGCTAVALLTLGRIGVVCWVGDSRAIAGVHETPQGPSAEATRGSPSADSGPARLVAVRLTEDHKPNRPEEKARIEKAGGHVVVVGGVPRVAPSDYQERTKRMKHEQCTMGGASQQPSTLLAVSRSFGDRDLKAEGLISCTPEAVLVPLTPSLRFILLACDGVWDALSDQEAVDIVSAHLHDADEATSKVVKAAFDKGSQDNLTAILVVFDAPETLPASH